MDEHEIHDEDEPTEVTFVVGPRRSVWELLDEYKREQAEQGD